MDFIFNELCFRDTFQDEYSGRAGMSNLLQVCKEGRSLGISGLAVRTDFIEQTLAAEYTVREWLNDQAVRRVEKDLFLAIRRYPYVDSEDTMIEERYILCKASLVDGDMSDPEGLVIAYLYKTLSISLCSAEKWKVDEISLKFVEEGYDEQVVKIRHASRVSHLENHKDWIASRVGVKLNITDLHVSEKKIRLRDDHGKDILDRFSRKLVRSPYVTGVINSMPFNCHDRDFIRNC